MRASTRASSSSGSMAPDPLRLVAVDPCRYATRRSAAAAARHSAPAAQRAPTCVQPPAHGTPRARHKHGCAAASTRPPAPRRAARGVNFGARATRRRCSTPGSPWAPRCRCRRAPRARSAWTRPSRGPRASTRRARTSTRASCASSSSAASWCVQGWHPHLLARQQATQSATPPSAACEARQTPRRACKHPSSFSFALPPTHCLRRQLQVRVQQLTSATPSSPLPFFFVVRVARQAPFHAGVEADDTDECDAAHSLEECPICMLRYPALNRSTCCRQGICTECFLQVKPRDTPAGAGAQRARVRVYCCAACALGRGDECVCTSGTRRGRGG